MTVTELKDALKKPPVPWLLLAGEEEYLKRYYLREVRRLLVPDGGFAAFNHLRFEGEVIDFGKLTDAIKTPPVFSEYKLIEWHLADFEKMREDELSAFAELCAMREGYPGVTVVFYAEAERLNLGTNPKRPAKRYTELAELIDVVYLPKSTDAQLIGWINRHLSHEGITPTPTLARALLSRCGHSMDILANELQKLAAYAHAKGRDSLTPEDVDTIASRNFEADAFGLGNAILAGDATLAYLNLADMKNRRIAPQKVLASVFHLFCDLYTVALLREEGLSPFDIHKKTGLHEYKVSLYLRAASHRTAASLGATLEKCRALDLMGKSGVADFSGLERLIAEEAASR